MVIKSLLGDFLGYKFASKEFWKLKWNQPDTLLTPLSSCTENECVNVNSWYIKFMLFITCIPWTQTN